MGRRATIIASCASLPLTCLDPQLVWKGKDEQGAADLQVPAVPIYIQETIDPLALIEELSERKVRQQPDGPERVAKHLALLAWDDQ
jgi:hypothetical protein